MQTIILLVHLIGAINTGDSTQIAKFAAQTYAAGYLNESGGVARAVRRWLEIHETFGRLSIDSVMTADSTTVTAWARGDLTRTWLNFRLQVADPRTSKVVRVGLGRGLRPEYATRRNPPVSLDKLGAYLNGYLKTLAAHNLFSGVVLVGSGDRVVFERGYGYADRADHRRNDDKTTFDVASVGKMFTAVAVAQLAERGKLSMADTLTAYALKLPPQLARRITIAQLLNHTSGLGELGPALDEAMLHTENVAQMLALLTDTVLRFQPGTSIEYSNRGYIVLGALVESVSGQDYFDYVRANVFNPAGMERAFFHRYDDRAENTAVRYSHYATLRSSYMPGQRLATSARLDVRGGPAGGVFASARDLFRFGRALENGGLISATMKRELTTPLTGVAWAYGFEVGANGAYGHRGAAPGATSYFFYFPTSGHTVVVLSNYDAAAQIVGDHIRELIEGS